MNLLFIEDNPDLAANLCDYFEQRGDSVDVAYDGPGGLHLAECGQFDAVVLDLMLPGMDGLEVCSELREAGVAVPILMLTARDTLDNKLEGFGAGADDYLVKPFALPELAARLTALVRRGRGEQARRIWTVEDLVYDAQTLRVSRAGRDIPLAPIPRKILFVLLRRAPAVVTRREVEQAIWGDEPPDTDALRSHLYTLRSAVDRKGEKPLIHTLRGQGYRLGGDEPAQ